MVLTPQFLAKSSNIQQYPACFLVKCYSEIQIGFWLGVHMVHDFLERGQTGLSFHSCSLLMGASHLAFMLRLGSEVSFDPEGERIWTSHHEIIPK